MASRTSGKGSQGTANTAKPRAGRTTGAAKKAASVKSPAKPPAKKAPAKKAAPAKRAPARKTAAKKPAPRPAPSPTGGVYRLARGAWLGLAHAIGAMFRG